MIPNVTIGFSNLLFLYFFMYKMVAFTILYIFLSIIHQTGWEVIQLVMIQFSFFFFEVRMKTWKLEPFCKWKERWILFGCDWLVWRVLAVILLVLMLQKPTWEITFASLHALSPRPMFRFCQSNSALQFNFNIVYSLFSDFVKLRRKEKYSGEGGEH